MSCKDEPIDLSDKSTHTQSPCHKFEESTCIFSQQQLNSTAVEKSSCSKPPVAPKPNHLSTGKSFKAITEMPPTTLDQGRREAQSSINEACQKKRRDSRNELLCGPQVQHSSVAITHSPRVPVPPLPHPYVQSPPASPPELPPRPRSTSPLDIRQKTNTITESETQPPLPPKSKTMSHHSVRQGEDLKVLPADLECSLTLTELADHYCNSFPVQVRVVQGFYGQTSSQTFNSHDTYNIICLKDEQVLVIQDENQHHYSIPVNSAIQFSLLYRHEEAVRGQIFRKVANIVALEAPPKVVCATKSGSGVERNEVLVIQGVHKPQTKGKNGLNVFSLLTRSKKTLPHDCSGDFSTDPSLIRMYPTDIHASLNHTLFPCDAKLYFNSDVADQLQSLPVPGYLNGVITIRELNARRSLVAYQVFNEDHYGEDPPIFDIPIDENLSDVEILVADRDLKNEFWEGQLTDSTVRILKSVSSNPSKLLPWKPDQSDATNTLLRKVVRRGYENAGITLKVNPEWVHSANMHELMEADAAADRECGYDTITFVHPDTQTSDVSEPDSPSNESNGYDSDRPQPILPPRSSSRSRSRAFTQIAIPRQFQAEDYILPVQNNSPIESCDGVTPPLRPTREKQCPVPLRAPEPAGLYTSPAPTTSRVDHEYATCISVSDCTGVLEENQNKSHPPKQELTIDLSIQQYVQEQVQKQLLSLMVGKKDGLSSTEAPQPTTPTPAPGDGKLQNSDLKYIMQALCDLSAWYLLGVYLDVPKGKLDQFHATYGAGPDAVERCKIETVCYWLENAGNPTWEKLADAALTMGRRGIVEKISDRCGGRLPIPEERKQHETVLQVSEIESLQKEMELKDQEFRRVEQKQGHLEEQLRNVQTELSNVQDWLQFNERLTRKLISDGERIQSDLTRAMSHESSHVSNQPLALHRKRDKITSLCKEQEQSKSKLEEAEKERRDLMEMLHDLESKITTTSQGLRQLQSEEQSARAALQLQEKAINERLVSSTEHQYYNIVILDGKVEMRVTQQQVEMLHMKIKDENLKVKQLHERLECNQQKLQEVTRQNGLLNRKSQAAAELDKHEREYLESTLEADAVQCQIEISVTEFHQQQMESRIHLLRAHLKSLRRKQGQYEQSSLKVQRGMRADFSRFSRTQKQKSGSASQRPLTQRKPLRYEDRYCHEQVNGPSVARSRIRHFHRNHSAHSLVGNRAMPIPSNGEQRQHFNPAASHKEPFIPRMYQRKSPYIDSRQKPHPPLPHFPSALSFFGNPRSAEEEYDDGYVIESLDELGYENGSNDDSMLNGMMYNEPMGSSQVAEYTPSDSCDSDDIDEVDECYAETELTFAQPHGHGRARQLPSRPQKPSKIKYM